jgi:tRNA U34 5-methylaminomethyl-2-thiouridine-forming methyltransferase MnmC
METTRSQMETRTMTHDAESAADATVGALRKDRGCENQLRLSHPQGHWKRRKLVRGVATAAFTVTL